MADTESKTQIDQTDWSLHPELFMKIFFSWKPDPLAEATDIFNQQWGPLKEYANPPWCLDGRVLSQVRSQNAQVILVAPVWKD